MADQVILMIKNVKKKTLRDKKTQNLFYKNAGNFIIYLYTFSTFIAFDIFQLQITCMNGVVLCKTWLHNSHCKVIILP